MSWRDLLSTEFEDATFNPAATTAEVRGAEAELGLEFPDELRTLLLESNGVAADHSQPLVWSAQEIVRQNRLFREHAEFPDLYMPFDCLLFFGADVNGDQFAYRILRGRIPNPPDVYRWDHETDSRSWFASSLTDYVRRLATLDA